VCHVTMHTVGKGGARTRDAVSNRVVGRHFVTRSECLA
jgi:hypothetical protein